MHFALLPSLDEGRRLPFAAAIANASLTPQSGQGGGYLPAHHAPAPGHGASINLNPQS